MLDPIYFDNAATTRIDERVIESMLPYWTTHYGNPSSIHALGRVARKAIEQSRKTVAQLIGASSAEIFFTSCGTEASNMLLHGAVRDLGVLHFISSPIEHHCVLHTLQHLHKQYPAVEVHNVDVLRNGHIDWIHLEQILDSLPLDVPKLVSLMHVNNEIGSLLDIERLARLCQGYRAYFHTDTVQSLGFYPIDVQKTPISFLMGSAHKFHGPKGIGFLYMNAKNPIHSLLYGGSQERNLRAGTENVANIVGLAKALQLAHEEMTQHRAHISSLKHYLMTELCDLEGVYVNGDAVDSHYKILNLSFPLLPSTELLLLQLDIHGVCASGGSACSSGVDVGSHVISALQKQDDSVNIRFSFSKYNTLAECEVVIARIKEIMRL
ncbi:MAG TPA: cysteine desulfurase family protein [Chitinophagales bacterium]|nr:cysteine desulfurase family protein [Chitinophagales bacterium]